jgi:glycosyltransferase involved in cell wall biosynthesis
MKVLFLNTYDDPVISGGGAEVILSLIAQGLSSCNIEPVILGTGPEPGLQQLERNGMRIWRAGIRNFYWPQPAVRRPMLARVLWHVADSFNFAMRPLLHQVLEAERPDVISVHNLAGWSVAAWGVIAKFGIPIVQVLHDSYLICGRSTMYTGCGNCIGQCGSCRLLRLPHRNACKHLSAVVGVSRFILDRHLSQGYFCNVPIQRVIHDARDKNILGLDAVAPVYRSEALRIGFIGRLHPSKGIELLLQAFSEADISGAALWVAGIGKSDYEKELRTRWKSEKIRFLGRVTPQEFYPQVDMVVVPSLLHDTFPGVVFEAFAFGKPVIGARRGGIPEMITDGENGFLFEPDRPDDLANAMRKLVHDSGLRARMGQVARVSAQPFLDKDAWVGRYADLYKEISK